MVLSIPITNKHTRTNICMIHAGVYERSRGVERCHTVGLSIYCFVDVGLVGAEGVIVGHAAGCGMVGRGQSNDV